MFLFIVPIAACSQGDDSPPRRHGADWHPGRRGRRSQPAGVPQARRRHPQRDPEHWRLRSQDGEVLTQRITSNNYIHKLFFLCYFFL